MALYKDITEKPFFIVGPCVMENQELLYTVAEKVAEIKAKYPVTVVFKSSFDKANRTSMHAYRGPGIEKGLEMLNKVKEKFDLEVTTDIHEPFQAKLAPRWLIFYRSRHSLCRQTDLLVAAAQTGKIVNIKKAQFFPGRICFTLLKK
jgi:2-dehydro-3-deoxyphosphooctonate aldolase (KDO 8-P synthase)